MVANSLSSNARRSNTFSHLVAFWPPFIIIKVILALPIPTPLFRQRGILIRPLLPISAVDDRNPKTRGSGRKS